MAETRYGDDRDHREPIWMKEGQDSLWELRFGSVVAIRGLVNFLSDVKKENAVVESDEIKKGYSREEADCIVRGIQAVLSNNSKDYTAAIAEYKLLRKSESYQRTGMVLGV